MIVAFIATVLVSALWQPAVVAGGAWLVLRLSRCSNATTKHAVWSVALAASVVLPFASAAAVFFPKAQVPSSAAATTISVPPAARFTHVDTKPAAVMSERFLPQIERPRVVVHASFAQVAVGIWALAALALAGQLAFSFLYLERLKRDALPLPVDQRADLARWHHAEKGQRDVRICVSSEISVPVAVGIFDAMILLPKGLIEELDAADLDRVLLHELAHVRRSDDWVNLLERFALALFFFSPALYVIARQMDLEREVACDDWVLAQALENVPYARCLTRIVEMTNWPHRALAAPGVFVTRKSMSIRIERLLARGRDIRVRLALVPSLISVAAIAAIAIAGGLISPTIAYSMDAPIVANRSVPAKHEPVPSAQPHAAHVAAIATATATPAQTASPARSAAPEASPTQQVATSRPAPSASSFVVAMASAPPAAGPAARGYLDELADAGLKNLSADDVIELKSVGVNADFIKQMRQAGLSDLSARMLVELKATGITPSYIASMRASGLNVSTAHEWTELHSLGVTPEYAAAMSAAGLGHLGGHELTELKAGDVTPDYVRELASVGYSNLSASQYMQLRSMDINAAYIRNLVNHGLTHLDVQKLLELKAEGIEPK